MRCWVLALIFLSFSMFSLPFLAIDAVATDISDCGTLDTGGTTYYLTSDITNSFNENCFTFTDDDIILDCQDHIVDCEFGTGYKGAVAIGRTNITIKNCYFNEWYTHGIDFTNSNYSQIINVTFNDLVGYGIYFSNTNYTNATNYTTISNGGMSVYSTSSDYNRFTTFELNPDSSQNGMYLTGSDNNNMSFGEIYGGGQAITFSNSDNNNAWNMTVNGSSYGAYFTAGATGNNVSNSSLTYNWRNVRIEASNGNYIYDNKLEGVSTSTGWLIYIEDNPSGNYIFNNLVNFTTAVGRGHVYFYSTTNTNYFNLTDRAGTRIFGDGTNIGGNYWTDDSGGNFSDSCTDSDTDGFCDNGFNTSTSTSCEIGSTCWTPGTDFLALSDEYSAVPPNNPPTIDDNTINDTTPNYWNDDIKNTLTCSDSDGGDTITANCYLYRNDVNQTAFATAMVVSSGVATDVLVMLAEANFSASDEVIIGCTCTDGTDTTSETNTSTATYQKIAPTGSLDSSADQTYPDDISLTASESNTGDGDMTYQVCCDNECIEGTSGSFDYGVGTYTCKLNTTGGTFENFTSSASIDSDSVTVSKGTLAGTISSPDVTYPDDISATGSESNVGDGDVTYQICCGAFCIAGKGASTYDLGGGTYDCVFNTTDGTFANWTSSSNLQTDSVTVNKGTLSGTISSPDVDYPNDMSITGSESNVGDDDVVYQTCVDNECKSGKGANTFDYGAGSYTCMFNTTGDTFENYTSTAELQSDTCAVNKGTLSGGITSPDVDYPNDVSVSCSETNEGDSDVDYETCCDSDCVAGLSSNFDMGVGAVTCKLKASGTWGNWTTSDSIISDVVTINKGTLTLSINKNVTSPIDYLTASDVQGTGCVFTGGYGTDVTCTLYRGNSSWSDTGNNVNDTAVLGVGIFSYNYSTPGGANWTSATASNYTLTVEKVEAEISLMFNSSNSNITLSNNSIINITANTTDTLYGDKLPINLTGNYTYLFSPLNGTTNITNITTVTGEGMQVFNITAYTDGNANYTGISITRYIFLDSENPNLYSFSINDSYININQTAKLEINATDTVSIDQVLAEIQTNVGTINFTVPFNSTSGNYTLLLNKTNLGDQSANATLLNITNIYVNDTGGNQNNSASTLQIDYARTDYLSDVDPSTAYNSFGQTIEFWIHYNTTENVSLIGSVCELTTAENTYTLTWDDISKRFETFISVYNAIPNTYGYTIECTNNSYQTMTASGTYTIITGSLDSSSSPSGGGSSEPACVEEGKSCVRDADCCGKLICQNDKCTKVEILPTDFTFSVYPTAIRPDDVYITNDTFGLYTLQDIVRVSNKETDVEKNMYVEYAFTCGNKTLCMKDWCKFKVSTDDYIEAGTTRDFELNCPIPMEIESGTYSTTLLIWARGYDRDLAKSVVITLNIYTGEKKGFFSSVGESVSDATPDGVKKFLTGVGTVLNFNIVCANSECEDNTWVFWDISDGSTMKSIFFVDRLPIWGGILIVLFTTSMLIVKPWKIKTG